MSALSEPVPFEVYKAGVYLHGTKADLAVGDLLVSGRESNFEAGRAADRLGLGRIVPDVLGRRELVDDGDIARPLSFGARRRGSVEGILLSRVSSSGEVVPITTGRCQPRWR